MSYLWPFQAFPLNPEASPRLARSQQSSHRPNVLTPPVNTIIIVLLVWKNEADSADRFCLVKAEGVSIPAQVWLLKLWECCHQVGEIKNERRQKSVNFKKRVIMQSYPCRFRWHTAGACSCQCCWSSGSAGSGWRSPGSWRPRCLQQGLWRVLATWGGRTRRCRGQDHIQTEIRVNCFHFSTWKKWHNI